MRVNLNYDALRGAADDGQKRQQLFASIKAALLLPPMLVDMLGTNRALKFAANDPNLIQGQKAAAPTIDEVKDYLRSERAARFLGGQKWAVPADNPALTSTSGRMVEFFHENIRDMDLGYLALFDEVDMRRSSEDHFEVIGTSLGISWQQLKPGEAIKPRREISEAKTTVSYLTLGAGLSLLDDWLRFNKFYLVSDAVNEFVSTAANKKVELHYGLLTALGSGINTAFATDDATTFNNAAAKILRACEAKGYAIGSNAQLDIVVNPEKVGRVLAMLDARRGSPMVAYGTQKQPIAFQVRNVISTTKVPSDSTGYYLVLPGRKLKRATWTDLTIESKREASVSAEDWYGREQYNAVIGDSDQVSRVLFA